MSKEVEQIVIEKTKNEGELIASVLGVQVKDVTHADNLMMTIIARVFLAPAAQIFSIILDKYYVLFIDSNISTNLLVYSFYIMRNLCVWMVSCLDYPMIILIAYIACNLLHQSFIYFYEEILKYFKLDSPLFLISPPYEYIAFNIFIFLILIFLKKIISNPLIITLSIATHIIIRHLFRCIYCICNDNGPLNYYSYSHQMEFFLLDIGFLWPVTFYKILYSAVFGSIIFYLFLTILLVGHLYYIEKSSLQTITTDIITRLYIYFFYNNKQFYKP